MPGAVFTMGKRERKKKNGKDIVPFLKECGMVSDRKAKAFLV